MRTVDLIIKKKQGLELSKEEIEFLIEGYVSGSIPDYQMSSLLMAICFQGLNHQEQVNLTMAMLHSGETIDLSGVNGICVDKHSTGGVGDKTTLVVAPIVSACGLKMAKMSGRGLGHTGGTLDKLESIPGFKIAISPDDFFKQVSEIGLAVVGQTANIAPADKKLYALRDVTGTVESVGLIAGSIMSKKLASGAHNILLDVKVGDGAFMKNLHDAQELAKAMVQIGNSCGRKTVAMITDMDQPLGEAVGNSLEVIEAIETLKGNGPKLFTQLCYELSSQLLLMSNIANTKEEALSKVKQAIESKKALQKLGEMITYQHGDARVIDDYSLLKVASREVVIKAHKTGYVTKIHTLQIGNAAMCLGAGRLTKEDNVDLSVGLKIKKHVGDMVHEGDVLAIAYVNKKGLDEIENEVLKAFEISSEEVKPRRIILDCIE